MLSAAFITHKPVSPKRLKPHKPKKLGIHIVYYLYCTLFLWISYLLHT